MTDLSPWLTEMEGLAENATPGERSLDEPLNMNDITVWAEGEYLANLVEIDHDGKYALAFDIHRVAGAKLIASLPPETVRAMLECVRALEASHCHCRFTPFSNQQLCECPRCLALQNLARAVGGVE